MLNLNQISLFERFCIIHLKSVADFLHVRYIKPGSQTATEQFNLENS